jgi:prophage antirepressor-like protein
MKENNSTKNNIPQAFDFDNHQIRTTVDENNNPFFVAKDVCEVLEIKNSRDAIKQVESRLKEAGLKGVVSNDTLLKTIGGKQTLITINEQGLYELIFASRKKQAVKFRTWVTGQVLPQLRQTGTYTYEQPKQLGRTQADSARKTINKFIKNYELKHAPKGQSINSRRALMQVHSFIRKYFNIDSYKNLDTGDLSTLNHSLNDNATVIFSSVKDLFVIDLNDQDAIYQTNNSIRIAGKNGHVRHLSLGYVLEQLDKAEEKKILPLPDNHMPHHMEMILEAVQGTLNNCNNQLDMVKSSELNLDLDQRLRIMKSILPNFKVCMTNIEIVAQSLFVDNYKEAKNTSAKEVIDNIGYSIL